MPVSFPLTLPGVFHSMEVTLHPRDVVGVSVAPQTGTEQIYEFPGKWWEVSIKLPPMKRRNAEIVIGTLLALRGATGTFYLGDTSYKLPQGAATGTPLTNGVQTPGSTDLLTKGWTASVTGILLAGDWVQIGTGTGIRLHKVLFDANSDSSGHATLTVWPNLRDATASGVSIILAPAQGIFMLEDNVPWTIDVAKIYGIQISARERLNLT